MVVLVSEWTKWRIHNNSYVKTSGLGKSRKRLVDKSKWRIREVLCTKRMVCFFY